jgi:hypothetical protein
MFPDRHLTERWASELFSDEDKLVRLRFLQTRITEYRMSLQHATDASESASIAAKKLDGYLSTSEISQSLNHSLVELYSAALTRMTGSKLCRKN